jgi:hypothetical protein
MAVSTVVVALLGAASVCVSAELHNVLMITVDGAFDPEIHSLAANFSHVDQHLWCITNLFNTMHALRQAPCTDAHHAQCDTHTRLGHRPASAVEPRVRYDADDHAERGPSVQRRNRVPSRVHADGECMQIKPARWSRLHARLCKRGTSLLTQQISDSRG